MTAIDEQRLEQCMGEVVTDAAAAESAAATHLVNGSGCTTAWPLRDR